MYIERMRRVNVLYWSVMLVLKQISDPGHYLVTKAHLAAVPVRVISGPSAVISAMSVSGFTHPFHFLGFAPRKDGLMKQINRCK